MGFKQGEAETLMVQTARMCAICHRPHGVQLHHIVPRAEGGSDEIDNAIPLCPNCHDEVHASGALGRVSRRYSTEELKRHRQATIELAARQSALVLGSADVAADSKLLLFYAHVLDRPAFRVRFHEELSFEDFDRALEDTALALNTGYWRTRDGTVIRHAEGRIAVVNPAWRVRLDEAASAIEEARHQLRAALGLDQMLDRLGHGRWIEVDRTLRADRGLGARIDELRQRAIGSVNVLLTEVGRPGLKGIGQS